MMEHQLSSEEREREQEREREKERERERERKNRFTYSSGGADTPRSASQPPSTSSNTTTTSATMTNGSEGFYSFPVTAYVYGSEHHTSGPVRSGNGNGNGNNGNNGNGQNQNGNGNSSGALGAGGGGGTGGGGNGHGHASTSSPWAMSGSGNNGRGGPSLGRSASSSVVIGVPSSLPQSHTSPLSERLGYGGSGSGFSNAMRETHSFSSTYEDDESQSEILSDGTGEFSGYTDPPPQSHSQQFRGRHFFPSDTRSRSQSLATATSRPLPIGSPPTSAGGGGGWSGMTAPLSIPGRFGDINPPSSGSGAGGGGGGLGSRYGSLGALARSPVGGAGASPSPTAGLRVNTGHAHGELTNISPLARDVGPIMLDEESWNTSATAAGGIAHGGGNNGGDSGTTSRRHSVSVVQPRRGIVGFNAPDSHGVDDNQPYYGQNGTSSGRAGVGIGGSLGSGGGGGLAITDDELAVSLNTLNLNQQQQPGGRGRSSFPPPSQPSSLPIYAPLSGRTSHEAGGPGGSFAESLGVGSEHHFPSRGRILRSPSEGGYSVSSSSGSPPRNVEHSPALESAYLSRQHQHQHQQHQAQQQRYVPGQGFQYIPEDGPAPNPPSPTFMRSMTGAGVGGGVGVGVGPNTSFMALHGQMGAARAQLQQQQQIQQFLHQHQQQQLGGAPSLQRRTSGSGEGFLNISQGAGLSGGVGIGGLGQGMPPPLSQQQQQQQQMQQQQSSLSELGRGIPLHAVPDSWHLYIVEFKAGRTDLFYVADSGPSSIVPPLQVGDLVIVEADRGKDLGKIVNDTITAAEVEAFQRQQQQQQAAVSQSMATYSDPTSPDSAGPHTGPGAPPGPPHGKKEINPKKIYGKASPADVQMLVAKHQDEAKALALCQSKVKAKKLPMEVIDAEYQWDRRKLTFYFIAEKRIDFRELVRELFRLYKTRIWMASLQGPTSPE